MSADAYDALADVYDWFVPDALLTPEASAEAFGEVVAALAPGARILDCAAGTGQLAVGLALRGFAVVASDASRAMVARTRRLARERGVEVAACVCVWDQLSDQGWGDGFDAVLCVGNSLAHADTRARRRAALCAMAGALNDAGVLIVTSRNWDLVRREGPGLRVAERLVERAGKRGLVIYAWTIPDDPGAPHAFDAAVAFIADGGEVTTHGERLRFAPFTHQELDEDLRAAGLAPASSTYTAEAERYMVTAVRRD